MGTIPEDEQLEALVSGKTWELAERYADRDYQRLKSMFTVTLESVIAYAREHGLSSWVQREPATYDGLYFIEEDGRYCVYAQDRGRLDSEKRCFDTEPEAFEYLIATYYMP